MGQPGFVLVSAGQREALLCTGFLNRLEDWKSSALRVFHFLLGASGLAGHVLLMAKRKTQEKKNNILASFHVYVMPSTILLAKTSWMAEPKIPDEGQS